ncbi:hypothetical protein Tco_0798796 [Tanacetum coccineum]
MDFPKFYKELEAKFWGASAKLMGLQLLQLEHRLGKTSSRSFRPVKSAEILWQFWASSSFGVSLAYDGSWRKSPVDSTDHATKHIITEGGDHVHEEQIKEQKRIEESAKAEAAKYEVEVRREELVDLLGPDVVSKYYKSKLQLGPITLKVYKEDSTDDVIPNFKASDLHLSEWREVVKACPNKKGKPLSGQDPLDKLNDLAKRKRKNADDIHDYFTANKRIKSSVQYKDHPARTVLNEHSCERHV